MNPKVSIILPTYNGAKYIKRAIDSILSQSFSDWELLIIDDGSVDNTNDIIQKYMVNDSRIFLYKNEKNLGVQKSANKGLSVAKGEYIARIDDDDIWIDKDKLRKQVQFLDRNLDYVIVGTNAISIDENDKILLKSVFPETDKEIRNSIIFANSFIHSSVVFRKQNVLSFGGYSEDEEDKNIEDYALFLKIGVNNKMYILNNFFTAYKIRKNSISYLNKRDQILKSIKLSRKYKNKYPNYYKFLIRSYIRYIIYGFILKKPITLYFQ